jgi:hypothetical protein
LRYGAHALLKRLLSDERIRGWTLQGIEKGCLLTNEAIFRAVAKCPVRANAKRVWFDADEFFEIALKEWSPKAGHDQGRAEQAHRCSILGTLSNTSKSAIMQASWSDEKNRFAGGQLRWVSWR